MDAVEFNSKILSLTDRLYRFAKSILRNQEAAEDAVQELNLKLWEKRHQLDEIENFQAFTMRSMRNLCLDSLRLKKEQLEIPTDVMYDAPNPHQQTEAVDMAGRIMNMINKLPELQRTIIRMRDVEGMEIGEIAFITQLNENAVSVNLSRARQKIREQIIKEHKRVEENIW